MDSTTEGQVPPRAKVHLADEYDAAQERGEVGQQTGRPKVVQNQNDFTATAHDVGLSRGQIHEARQIRNAEKEKAGRKPFKTRTVMVPLPKRSAVPYGNARTERAPSKLGGPPPLVS